MRRPLMLAGFSTTSGSSPTPNSPPSIDLNGGGGGVDTTLSFTEGDLPTLLCPLAVVSDPDISDISYLTIVGSGITADSESVWFDTEQFLLDSNKTAAVSNGSVDFEVSYVASSKTFTVTGVGGSSESTADFQQLVRLLKYDNTEVPVTSGDRDFSFVVNDGSNDSPEAIVTVSVLGVNYAPEVDLNGVGVGVDHAITFTEGDGTTILCSDALISDDDGDPLTSMTIVCSGVTADDEIISLGDSSVEFSLDSDLTTTVTAGAITFGVAYTTSDKTFLLAKQGGGSATTAQWQALLRTLKYVNDSVPVTAGERGLIINVSDGVETSPDALLTITVVGVSGGSEDTERMSVLAWNRSYVPLLDTEDITTDQAKDLHLNMYAEV